MKKYIILLLTAMLTLSVNAQRSVTKVQETQARLLDVTSNAYVHPLTVELKVLTTKSVSDKFYLTKDQVENEMRGDMANIRSYGVFMSSKAHQADVIVAATFNFKTSDERPGFYELEVVGYPAVFVNWKTAVPADYEWIRMEKTQTTADYEKIKAVVK